MLNIKICFFFLIHLFYLFFSYAARVESVVFKTGVLSAGKLQSATHNMAEGFFSHFFINVFIFVNQL